MITASELSSQYCPVAFIDGVFVADSSVYLSLPPSISLPSFLLENLTLCVVLLFSLLGYCHKERFFSTRKQSGFFLFFATQEWVGVFLICQKKYALAETIFLSGRKGGRGITSHLLLIVW
jgi:hypothetical protein